MTVIAARSENVALKNPRKTIAALIIVGCSVYEGATTREGTVVSMLETLRSRDVTRKY